MDWGQLSLAEQLGNVGSEFERALRWRRKRQPDLARSAALRTLEQLDRTLADDRHAGSRRREIARLRDEVCRELFLDDANDGGSGQTLERYFLALAALSRRER